MKHQVVRKAVLRHAKSLATMTVLVFETTHGFSYSVDNFTSMPMSRRTALSRYNAVVEQYTTHQNFVIHTVEGEL